MWRWVSTDIPNFWWYDKNIMTKATYSKAYLSLRFRGPSGARVHRSRWQAQQQRLDMLTWRHEAEKDEIRSRWCFKPSTPNLITYVLQQGHTSYTFLNSVTNKGPNIQMPRPMEDISYWKHHRMHTESQQQKSTPVCYIYGLHLLQSPEVGSCESVLF